MGIFGAMLTAVSGLRAQAYSLENISGNIANSQTTGFKRVDTSFVDLVPDAPYKREVAGTVTTFARLTNTLAGDIQPTGVSTNMALNGEGFFIVQERTGYANNQPVFNNSDLYSRRGDFTLDKDGYLVNGAGFYLKGSSIDAVTGEVSGTSNGVVRLSNEPLPAERSTQIAYNANLPNTPATASRTAERRNSELLIIPPDAAAVPPEPGLNLFTNNPVASPPTATDGFIRGDDQSDFINRSVSGDSITVYNDVGAPINLQLRWAKVSNTSGDETWNLFSLMNSNATAGQEAWRNLGAVSFQSNGQLTSASPRSLTVPNLPINGASIGGPVTIEFGERGLTQYSSSSGLLQASLIQQDGYPPGNLESVSVTSDGRVSGSYSNGRVVPVAAIAVAQFNADNALKRRDGGVYEQTLESGIPTVGLNGTSVIGGNVEGSNTDVAEEFTKMIVTQQAYSANTRVVSTSQQMLTEVINMVR